MKPMLGILGGCGPWATVHLEQQILQAVQRLERPHHDQDHHPLISYQLPQLPDRYEAQCQGGMSPLNKLRDATEQLTQLGVDFLLLACVSAHAYRDDLRTNQLTLIDGIQALNEAVDSQAPCGLLCSQASWEAELFPAHHWHTPSDWDPMMQAIHAIKAGRHVYPSIQPIPGHRWLSEDVCAPLVSLLKVVDDLHQQGCQQMLLACTELPLLLPELQIQRPEISFIDGNQVLAEALVGAARVACSPEELP